MIQTMCVLQVCVCVHLQHGHRATTTWDSHGSMIKVLQLEPCKATSTSPGPTIDGNLAVSTSYDSCLQKNDWWLVYVLSTYRSSCSFCIPTLGVVPCLLDRLMMYEVLLAILAFN